MVSVCPFLDLFDPLDVHGGRPIVGFVCGSTGSSHARALSRHRVRSYRVERYVLPPPHIRLIGILIPFLAVTHAVLTNWEYMDVIRRAADPKCSSSLVNSITTIDSLLKVDRLRVPLKKLFGLGELASDQDFVSVLTVRPSSYPCPPDLVVTRNGRLA